ncbi:MAG TPA: DUF6445 family protein [Thermoanaerobaculia bacterium]|nr:DUF6445 family protein [Thermoanaerobaculia bacterium]
MTKATYDKSIHRFLLVRDGFYSDPDRVRRIALSMKYAEHDDATGYMTGEVYHERGIRNRLEKILGIRITRWDTDPEEGNGIFYGGFASGANKEVPGVHYDFPIDDITVVVYLTEGIPFGYGTSLWQHKSTGLLSAPLRADAYRLKKKLSKLRDRLDADATKRDRWIEVDRVGYRYNRLVAYPSAVLHSATRHFGSSVEGGRIYQTFRIGVDWRSFRVRKWR